MNLCELSEGYLEAAKLLQRKLALLRKARKLEPDAQRRLALTSQIQSLAKILTQCNDLAELTAHYYERGFTRNGKYTL